MSLDAGGREAEIHSMYDLVVNASYIERTTAMHWNFSGDELGIMHYIEGDVEAFRADVESIQEVLDYELTLASEDAFYAYIRDATNEPLRELFGAVTRSPVVVVPSVEYGADGSVSYSALGPSAAIQRAIEAIPTPITITVSEIGGMKAVPGVLEALLSERQREAAETAFSLGYYEIPRETGHEDVAVAMDCASSTAAEHLRKAEAKLLQSVLGS